MLPLGVFGYLAPTIDPNTRPVVYAPREVCLDPCFHCSNFAPLMQYTVGS